jgi:alginate O-acetyltransferase complex protein AlgI
MAIGLGLMIGLRFPINFERPYCSISITDFWRRWHISLSSFLRDYLYVPLGGNRRGPIRTYVNLALTMLIGGLWHGASWTFIAWGAYQGTWLIIERLLGKRSPMSGLPRPLQILGTFVLVMIGWVFFRAETLGGAFDHLGAMFGTASGAAGVPLRKIHLAAFLLGAACLWGAPTTQASIRSPRLAWVITLQVGFIAALMQLHHVSHVPFLYFQF